MKLLQKALIYSTTLLIIGASHAVPIESKGGYKVDAPLLGNGDTVSGFVSLKNGFQATRGATITFDTDGTINGPIYSLGKENFTILLASDLRLGTCFEVKSPLTLYGHHNTLFLGGALRLADTTPLTILGETIINGIGNELSFEKPVIVGESARLTLRNMNILGTKHPHLFTTVSTTKSIELDTVTLHINNEQKLVEKDGNIVIRNNVTIKGNPGAKAILPEKATLTIMPHATLSIEGATLVCESKDTEDQIRFIDETSTMHLNQSSLEMLGDATFTKGKILCNNEVIMNIHPNRTLTFGDGANENNNFNFVLLGGTSVKLDGSGIIVDRSV